MSKKISLLLAAVSMFFAVNVFASWTPVQLSFWDGVKNLPNSETVNGVKIGLPYAGNYWGLNQEINGLEVSIFAESANSTGLQLSLVNLGTVDCAGMQLAGASISKNFTGFQMGAYNEVNDASTAAQLGFTNTSKRNSKAVLVGVINNAADQTTGTQIGAINASYAFKGVQIGVINTNYRDSSSSLQIGLINYMENGFLPIFPFFNYASK